MDGLTGNTVKFLVELDINSKKSTRNINTYLDTVKEKKINAVVNVLKGQSTKNVNGFFTTINKNPKKVNAVVDILRQKSRTNINSFITSFTPANVQVALSVAKDGFSAVIASIQGTTIKGLKLEGQLNEEKTIEHIGKQIAKMKLPKFNVDVNANIVPVINKAQIDAAIKNASENLPITAKNTSQTPLNKDAYKNTTKDAAVKQLKEDYKELGREVYIFNRSVSAGEQAFIKMLKSQGKEVTTIRNERTKEIKKITATYKDANNKTQTLYFTPLKKEYSVLNKQGKAATRVIRGFVANIERVKDTDNFNIGKGIDSLIKKLETARRQSELSYKEYEKFLRIANSGDIKTHTKLADVTKNLDIQIDRQKELNKLKKIQSQIEEQVSVQMAKLTRAQRMYPRYYEENKETFAQLRAQLNSGIITAVRQADENSLLAFNRNGKISQVTSTMGQATRAIRDFTTNATEATRTSMSLGVALRTAFERFPVWMIASTTFFTVIGTFREFGRILVDIDTKLVSIQKVTGSLTDMSKIFDEASASAMKYGQSISDTLDAYIEFARQGYKGEDLNILAETGLISANVAELNVGQASEYITSVLAQYNMETKESIRIIDSLNNVSNNFATTSEKIFQGLSKSAATSKSMNVSFDQSVAVIGALTARLKQSGSEIGNFWKTAMARLVGQPAQDAMAKLGVSLTDSNGNLKDVIELYTEIAEKTKDISEIERIAVSEGLAGKYHISRMQSLLDDLGSANSLYRQIYEASVNSSGSAFRENEVYMQSLQARINTTRVEIEKLAIAMGEAFITETMIGSLKAFSSFLSFLTTITAKIGGLPLIIGAVGIAVASFSIKVRGLALAFYTKTIAVAKSITSYTALKAQMLGTATTAGVLTTAIRGIGTALMTLVRAAVFTAPFVLGAIAIERLLASYTKVREAREHMVSELKKDTLAYSQNRAEINNLAKEYDLLSKKQDALLRAGSGLDTRDLNKFVSLQNELGGLMPSLIRSETEQGDKILISSQNILAKVAALEAQIDAQERLNKAEAEQDKRDIREDNDKIIKKEQKTYNALLVAAKSFYNNIDNLHEKSRFVDESLVMGVNVDGNALKSVEDVSRLIANLEKSLQETQGTQMTFGERFKMEHALENLRELEITLLQSEVTVNGAMNAIRDTFVTDLNEIIDASSGFSDEGKEVFSDVANSVLTLADTSKSMDKFNLMMEKSLDMRDADLPKAFNEFSQSITDMKNSSIADVNELETQFKPKLNALRDAILQASNLTEGSDEYRLYQYELDRVIASNMDFEASLRETAHAQGITVDQARAGAAAAASLGDGYSEASDDLSDYLKGIHDYSSYTEQLLGITEDMIDKTDDLIRTYEYLNQVTELSAEEQIVLQDSMNALKSIYPHLVRQGEIRIDSIIEEQKANKILREAYENWVDDKFTTEEQATYISATGTKARIDNAKEEIATLQALNGLLYSRYEEVMNKYNNGITLTVSEQNFLRQSSHSYSKYREAQEELDKSTQELNYSLNSLSAANNRVEESTDSSRKSNKEAAKSNSELEKITDKYALAMDKLDTALKSVQSKQKTYVTHSKSYRKSLQDEIDLLQQQADLNNQKIKDLGTVPKNNAVTTTSSSTSVQNATASIIQPKGFSGVITSAYGHRSGEFHQGIDIDGAKGTTLQANVNGTVLKAGNASSIGEHSSYGNLVIIKDKDNKKHYYAHMDNITVVEGQQISAGTTIGTIGNSGNTYSGSGGDGSHLHYEVRDANNKHVDPYGYLQDARSGVMSIFTGATTGANASSSDDYAKALSETEKLLQENIGIDEQQSSLRFGQLKSQLEEIAYNRQKENDVIAQQGLLQENMLKHSRAYEDSVNKQYTAEQRKLKSLQNEYNLVAERLKVGDLTEDQSIELIDHQAKLNQEIQESVNASKGYYNEVIESNLARFDNKRKDLVNTITYEETKIKSVDKASERYNKTLDIINKAKRTLIDENKREILYAEQMLKAGNLTIEMYEELADRVNSLTNESMILNEEIRNNELDKILSASEARNEKIQDLDFLIGRSQGYRSLYDDTSFEYKSELEYELARLEEKLKLVKEDGRAIQNDMRNADLGHTQLALLEEQLEANAEDYLAVKKAIKDAKDELTDFTKRVKEQTEELRETIADEMIDALKDAYEELRDIQLDAIDKLIDKENDRHDKVIQDLEDEKKAFKASIDERLRQIDDAESENSYNKDIEKLQKERDKIQKQLTLLALDDSKEAKAKRKTLQEQLDEIDREIEEKRHDRQIELQKQSLSDMLDQKEKEIDEKIALDNKQHDNVIKNLESQKQFLVKYYEDMLNNEREFERKRKQMMEGNFTEIEKEFGSHISILKSSLGSLGIEVNGTFTNIGTQIRKNVISTLEELLDKIKETEKSIKDLQNSSSSPTWEHGSSSGSSAGNGSTDAGSNKTVDLQRGDAQVLLAKYMKEKLTPLAKNDGERAALRDTADKIAAAGRSNDSTIPVMQSFDESFQKLSDRQKAQLGQWLIDNSGVIAFGDLRTKLVEYAENLKLAYTSLDTGGMVKRSSTGGIDGKGGGLSIIHPNEIVSNPIDSQNMIKSASILDNIMRTVSSMIKTPSLKNLFNNKTDNTNNDTYIINFNIDEMIANKEAANNMSNEIINSLKLRRGMKKF